jgi:hypothetical protein
MTATQIIASISIAATMIVGPTLAAQPRVEPWQLSWDRFIADYNTCTKTAGCDLGKFADKEVTWTGSFVEIAPDGEDVSVRINLTPHALVDKDGKELESTIPPQPLKDIDLKCKATEAAPWRQLVTDARVTFRGKTRRGSHRICNMGGRKFVNYYPLVAVS